MNVEERCIGIPVTPEVRALVRTVFERAFERAEDRIDRVRVRVMMEGGEVVCRARLEPLVGAALMIAERRPTAVEAVLASAGGLSDAFAHHDASHGERARRLHDRRRTRLAREV